MTREILILDVTAMSGDHVCVAGIDLDTKQTIRLSNPQPRLELLKSLGYLTPGEVIAVEAVPALHLTPPHIEDHTWNPRSVEKRGRMNNDEICHAIGDSVFESVEAAFGAPTKRGIFRNSGWSSGTGERSLATLRVRYVRFTEDENRAIRAALMDWDKTRWRFIPFQDLLVRQHRLQVGGCCVEELLARVDDEFLKNECLVRLGLTRRYPPDDHEDNSACWLQVTNVFARDRTHFV